MLQQLWLHCSSEEALRPSPLRSFSSFRLLRRPESSHLLNNETGARAAGSRRRTDTLLNTTRGGSCGPDQQQLSSIFPPSLSSSPLHFASCVHFLETAPTLPVGRSVTVFSKSLESLKWPRSFRSTADYCYLVTSSWTLVPGLWSLDTAC